MIDAPFVCPECGHNKGKTMFSVTVLTSARHHGHFTKADYALKETEVWGIDWANAWLRCDNCGWQKHPIYEQGRFKAAFLISREALIDAANALGNIVQALIPGSVSKARKIAKEAYREATKITDDDEFLPVYLEALGIQAIEEIMNEQTEKDS